MKECSLQTTRKITLNPSYPHTPLISILDSIAFLFEAPLLHPDPCALTHFAVDPDKLPSDLLGGSKPPCPPGTLGLGLGFRVYGLGSG